MWDPARKGPSRRHSGSGATATPRGRPGPGTSRNAGHFHRPGALTEAIYCRPKALSIGPSNGRSHGSVAGQGSTTCGGRFLVPTASGAPVAVPAGAFTPPISPLVGGTWSPAPEHPYAGGPERRQHSASGAPALAISATRSMGRRALSVDIDVRTRYERLSWHLIILKSRITTPNGSGIGRRGWGFGAGDRGSGR